VGYPSRILHNKNLLGGGGLKEEIAIVLVGHTALGRKGF